MTNYDPKNLIGLLVDHNKMVMSIARQPSELERPMVLFIDETEAGLDGKVIQYNPNQQKNYNS